MAVVTLALPNGELVAQAWISKYAGFPNSMVAGSLAPVEKWVGNRFITVRMLPSGNPHPELSERRSTIVQVDVWAAKPTSVKPLWGAALTAAEQIRAATFRDGQSYGRPIEMPVSGFLPARMQAAYLTTEPRRVENDPSAFARVTFDLAVDWTV